MRFRLAAVLLGFVLLTAAPASAQVWDSPMLAPPAPEMGYGFYLFEPPGADLGLLGTWRSPATRNVRVRFGLADSNTDDVAVVFGGDYSSLLRGPTPDFPLQVGWVIGAGLAFADDLAFSAPFGATFGVPLDLEDLRLIPYVTPRVVFDAFFDDNDGGDDTNLDFAFDLGLDARIGPTWGIRFGATIGDREAIAIGVVF